MFNLLEPGHLIPILLVALIVFGPKRLPELGKSLGGALREFRRGTQGLKEEFEEAVHDKPTPAETIVISAQPAAPVTVLPAAQAMPAMTETAVVTEGAAPGAAKTIA